MTTLAAQILKETAIASPDQFKDWVHLRDIRDSVLHPFDRERLRLAYQQGNAWESLKTAATSSEWLDSRGDGLELEVKARYIPYDTFDTLEESQERIAQLDTVFSHWKEVGHKLLLAQETMHNMRLHLKDTDKRLMRSLALVFHYKVLANEYAQLLKEHHVSKTVVRTLKPPTKEHLDSMWTGNLESFGSLKLLLKDTGILTDEAEHDA